jgi:hypothetical protein
MAAGKGVFLRERSPVFVELKDKSMQCSVAVSAGVKAPPVI